MIFAPFGKTYYEAKFANTVVRAFLFATSRIVLNQEGY